MTEPRDDFERRLDADLRAYLAAEAPRLDPRTAAQRAMASVPARSSSLTPVLGGALTVLVVAVAGLVILLTRAPLPPVGASERPSQPEPTFPSPVAPTPSVTSSPTPTATTFAPTSWSFEIVPTPRGHPDFVVLAATPDGSAVFFRDADTYEPVFVDQGGRVSQIVLPIPNSQGSPITLRLAPDGSFAVLEQFPELWRYGVRSGDLTKLPKLPGDTAIEWFDFAGASQLAVIAGRTDTPIHPTQLWTLDLETGSWSKVGTRSDSEIVFGTDRGLVLLVDESANHDQSGWHLYLAAPDGTDHLLYDASGAGWLEVAPDGFHLAYSTIGAGGATYAVDLASGRSIKVSDDGQVGDDAGRFAPDGSQFSVAFSDGHGEAFDLSGERTAIVPAADHAAWIGH